jgi:hypothetical protein
MLKTNKRSMPRRDRFLFVVKPGVLMAHVPLFEDRGAIVCQQDMCERLNR